jgi:adenosylcobinamide kinase/adenosylcobinamide-phosphate guanylyltransferase
MAGTILITGGARSGKSSYALRNAGDLWGRKAFIATMQPIDAETRERIEMHRAERGEGWETFEEPLEVPSLIRQLSEEYGTVVIDCLTLWLSNLMQAERDVEAETEALLRVLREKLFTGGIILVTNEVGMGIVPENELARRFRDQAGMLNRRVAEVAEEVYLMVAGSPLCVKGGGRPFSL